MAQFIPTVPGIGGALGTGLSKALESLAEGKIKKMLEAPGNTALSDLIRESQEGQASQNNQEAGRGSIPQGQQSQPSVEQLFTQLQQPSKPGQQGLEAKPGIQKNPLIEALQRGNVSKEELLQLSGLAPQESKQKKEGKGSAKQQPSAQPIQKAKTAGISPDREKELLSKMTPAQQQQWFKIKQERDKEDRKAKELEQRDINKSTQKYYDSVLDAGKAANNNLKRLKRLEELSVKGDLPPAELYKFLGKIEDSAPNPVYGAAAGAYTGAQIGALAGPIGAGIGSAAGGFLGAFLGPIAGTVKTALARQYKDTEEFEKLSTEFVKDAKGIFGGRITNADLEAFFKTIPTLNQTQEGRLKIMKNMRAFNEAVIAEQDALEEIIKENGGKRPDDLRFRVQRRTQEKLDKYAKQFEV